MKSKLLLSGVLVTAIAMTVAFLPWQGDVQAATPKATVIGADEDQPRVTLRAYEYQWAYRVGKNNKVEKRLFNLTIGQWASGSSWMLA